MDSNDAGRPRPGRQALLIRAGAVTAILTQTRQAGTVPPTLVGGLANRAMQPYPEAFGRSAAAWSIALPKTALDGVADLFLEIDYQGDIARLFSGTRRLDDDFYYGEDWTIGLKRFRVELDEPLTLAVLPLRTDAPIYLDDAAKAALRAALPAAAQVAQVRSVRVTPQYALKIRD